MRNPVTYDSWLDPAKMMQRDLGYAWEVPIIAAPTDTHTGPSRMQYRRVKIHLNDR